MGSASAGMSGLALALRSRGSLSPLEPCKSPIPCLPLTPFRTMVW